MIVLSSQPGMTVSKHGLLDHVNVVLRFLGAFAKFRKANIRSSCPSVHPSVRPSLCNILAPTGWIFIKFDILDFFSNLSKNFKFH